jgi:hypothetical protein
MFDISAPTRQCIHKQPKQHGHLLSPSPSLTAAFSEAQRCCWDAREIEPSEVSLLLLLLLLRIHRLPEQQQAHPPATPAAGRKASAAAVQPEKFNTALFDATMVAVCRELESNTKRRNELVGAAGAIRDAYVRLCGDKEFKAALDNRSKQKVLLRIDMMRRMLQDAAPPVVR